MRIGGLASGIDVDSLILDLMRAERAPLEKKYQQKQVLEWQRDDYRSINKKLTELDNFIFDKMVRKSTFTSKMATSSNEAAVTATANSSAVNGSMQIRVDQLAQVSTGASVNSIGGSTFDPNASLETAGFTNTNFGNSFTLSVFQPDGTMSPAKEITFDPTTDSLNSVLKKINDSGLGVTAFFDETTKKIAISTNHTGGDGTTTNVNGTSAEIVATGTFFTDALQFASNNLADGGMNAKVNVNGLDTEKTSNSFTLNNVNFNLKSITTTAVSVNVTTDTETSMKVIKDFVDKYNETIAMAHLKLSEEKFRDYQPLSNEEKDSMSEKQIELWESKAKSGLIRNDSIIRTGLTNFRMELYSKVEGTKTGFSQLAQIGITTSTNFRENGMLVIDEDKLKKALETDTDAVHKLFSQAETTAGTEGVAHRLRDSIKQTIKDVEKKAGNVFSTDQQYSIGRTIKDINGTIDRFEDRLIKVEDRYWKQFTAMEQAIAKANQQGAYLMQQFGGGM